MLIQSEHENKRLPLLLALKGISIKYLTIFGFSAVIVPMIIALLYGSRQLDDLSEKSATSIVQVASIVAGNRQLSLSLSQLQRAASQYIVLDEEEIFDRFLQHQKAIDTLLSQNFIPVDDGSISTQLALLTTEIALIQKTISAIDKPSLQRLQENFKPMNRLAQQIADQSESLVQQQVTHVQNSAKQAQKTMLNSLFIIPISVGIAVLFSILIVKPLNVLQKRIERLETGKFDEKIKFFGAAEVQNIAKALEQMRTQLHSLEQQKSSFIRHISHELKTPLAAIREGNELLYDNSVGPLNEGQQEITQIMRENVSRLQLLIEDLLDFNIVLDSTSLLQSEHIAVRELLSECLSIRSLDIKAKKIKIAQEINIESVYTNRKQISVVLDNLLSNAIKYSPQDGTINIHISEKDDELLLTVSDEGPGLPKNVIDKVFNAFYQGPAPTNNQIKSSGLGLTIVKELLRRLNGEICLTNRTNCSGLVATLTFKKLT